MLFELYIPMEGRFINGLFPPSLWQVKGNLVDVAAPCEPMFSSLVGLVLGMQ